MPVKCHIKEATHKVLAIKQPRIKLEWGMSSTETREREKYLLIRPSTPVHDALLQAARHRQMIKTDFIELLLTVIVDDNLIDAVLDDTKKT